MPIFDENEFLGLAEKSLCKVAVEFWNTEDDGNNITNSN